MNTPQPVGQLLALDTTMGRVVFVVEGTGAPVLVIPGGPGEGRASDPELAAKLRVISFDPLGTGASDRLTDREAYTPGLYAQTMLALLDHLSIPAAHLLAYSFGGVPAAEFAARFPSRVLSLVLSNAQVDAQGWQQGNIDALNLHVRRQYPEIWDALLALRAGGALSSDTRYQRLLSGPNSRMLWAGVDPLPMPQGPGGAFDFDTYLAFIGDDPEWRVAGSLAGHTVLDRLAPHRLPTLVISGRRDLMAAPVIAKRIADALDPACTTLMVFERSAHRPWIEEPAAYYSLLFDFFARYS